MPRPASRYPTDLELEILKVLWQQGPSTVRQVRDILAKDRDLAYTSVMTIMSIMTDKGYVRRRKAKGSYVYRPVLEQHSAARAMLSDVVNRVFDGSAAAAAVHLLESADIDREELHELQRLLERMGEAKS
jgi:predicted transcriptional regulator